MKRLHGLLSLALLAWLGLSWGCAPGKHSPMGFRLPEGDAESGKAAFARVGCIRCHTVHDVEDLAFSPDERKLEIMLGGDTSTVKTYGELVTSVINPDHVVKAKYRSEFLDADGNSLMPDLTKKMTVREMIDIVEFVQSSYDIAVPDYLYREAYAY